MQKINLIPEVKQQQLKIKKNNLMATTFAAVTAIVLGVLILLLLGYIVAMRTKISGTDSQKNMLQQQLTAYADLEKTVLSLETGLSNIKTIIKSDSKWLSIFEQIEKATPADIRFTSLKVAPDFKVTAQLEGKNVTSVDRFIKSFSASQTDKEMSSFSAVEVNGYTATGEKVTFSANFSINKEAF